MAVVWSGIWNLIGVLMSSGTVAFGVVARLPVELVLNVGSAAGMAMVSIEERRRRCLAACCCRHGLALVVRRSYLLLCKIL